MNILSLHQKYRLSHSETIDHVVKSLWEMKKNLYKKSYATNHALYLMISLFSLCFYTNTYLYPKNFKSSGFWTIGQKISRFVNEFNSAWIASFHFDQSFLCQHSSTFCESRFSSFLMMSKATTKAKILLITILFWSYFLSWVHNLLRSHNF